MIGRPYKSNVPSWLGIDEIYRTLLLLEIDINNLNVEFRRKGRDVDNILDEIQLNLNNLNVNFKRKVNVVGRVLDELDKKHNLLLRSMENSTWVGADLETNLRRCNTGSEVLSRGGLLL